MGVLGVAKKTKNPATLPQGTQWSKALGIEALEKEYLDGKISRKQYEKTRRKW